MRGSMKTTPSQANRPRGEREYAKENAQREVNRLIAEGLPR
jgi:hypothetical protein